MKIGYARVSKSDGSQTLDLQYDALLSAGVEQTHIYEDRASGKRDDRPGLSECLRALREGDVLVVWKLDRLGRSLSHLVATVDDLGARGIGLQVLAGQGANIDTTTAAGKMMFGIFASLAEFERELISERTKAGLEAARSRGRKGGRPSGLTRNQLLGAQAALQDKNTVIADLCKELGVARSTLYRYIDPNGELREPGRQLLGR